MASERKRVIVAIDFGTTYTALAYSFLLNDELKDVHVVPVCNQSNVLKSITQFIIDRNDVTKVLTFGEACSNSEDNDDYVLFHRFKMHLFGNKADTPIPGIEIFADDDEDEIVEPDKNLSGIRGGVDEFTLPLSKVISLALGHLKDRALEVLSSKGLPINPDSDIQWVLTVPAIWDMKAKSIMRQAAVDAGLVTSTKDEGLMLALEPECAALDCFQEYGDRWREGDEFLVVDCGGGTIDTVAFKVEEVQPTMKVVVSKPPRGNDSGGTQVDKRLMRLLAEMAGVRSEEPENDNDDDTTYEQLFPPESKETYSFLYDCWNEKKTTIESNTGEIVFRKAELPPGVFEKIVKGLDDWQAMSEYTVDVRRSLIKIPIELIISRCFIPVVDKIVTLSTKLLSGSDFKFVMLVGGFAKSHILKDQIRKLTQDHERTFICPQNPHLSIVKGAVRYGYNPLTICARQLSDTYGLKTSYEAATPEDVLNSIFHVGDPNQTDEDRELLQQERTEVLRFIRPRPGRKGREASYWIPNYFKKLVRAGQMVKVSHKAMFRTFMLLRQAPSHFTMRIVKSSSSDMVCISDKSARIIGRVGVPLPGAEEAGTPKVEVIVEFLFAGPELKVSASWSDGAQHAIRHEVDGIILAYD